jgi:hypothetical protein
VYERKVEWSGGLVRVLVRIESWKVGRRGPTPAVFVSVAFKGVSSDVSLLFAALVGKFVSVAAKGVRGVDCW